MRYPILATMLDAADRIRLAEATKAAGRDLLSESTPLPVFVIAENAARLPDLDRRTIMGNDTIEVIRLTDAQAADLIRHDASNNPVDVPPALPPRAEWRRLFEDPPVWHARGKPQSKRPPAGKPGRRRPSPWWVRTPEERAEKRAKRKAAEKSRRRNRR